MMMNYKATALVLFVFFASVGSLAQSTTDEDPHDAVVVEMAGAPRGAPAAPASLVPQQGDLEQGGQVEFSAGPDQGAWYYNPCWQRCLAVSCVALIGFGCVAAVTGLLVGEEHQLSDKADQVTRVCTEAVG